MKKMILGFILGLVVAGGVGVLAYTITADKIGYSPKDSNWKVTNVSDAIDDIKKNGTNKKFCELKSGEALAIGSMYECDPGDGTKRNFYVLKTKSDSVSLIMDRNISEGTMTWNNAMKYIANNNLETSWKYVASVDLPKAQDIADAADNSSWKTVDSGSTWWCFASHKQDMQSAPYCNTSGAQAYNWLYDYTRVCNGCSHSLSDTNGQPYGYWTRDAVNETSTARAWNVSRYGYLDVNDASSASGHGVRPVITILKSNIQ